MSRFVVAGRVSEIAPQSAKCIEVDGKIVRYARDTQVTMIVMSTHGHSGLAHMLMGSTTEAVRKASCPVLSIRNLEMRFEMP
jgi:nucleotide-binding universal stress UspA family protein